MFASCFVAPDNPRFRFATAFALLAASLAATAPAAAAPVCKPAFTVKDVRFSEAHPETMQRTWTALLSVDAGRCATISGRFEIVFTRLKENAPEIDFFGPFVWRPGVMDVSVEFWADEAVEAYRLTGIAACPCK